MRHLVQADDHSVTRVVHVAIAWIVMARVSACWSVLAYIGKAYVVMARVDIDWDGLLNTKQGLASGSTAFELQIILRKIDSGASTVFIYTCMYTCLYMWSHQGNS